MGSRDDLVIDHQASKGQVDRIVRLSILAHNFYHSLHASQIERAAWSFYCGVPVEMLTEQSVTFSVINKGTRVRVIYRESVCRSYPQTSQCILHHTSDGIVGKSVVSSEHLEGLLACLRINDTLIDSIAVGT